MAAGTVDDASVSHVDGEPHRAACDRAGHGEDDDDAARPRRRPPRSGAATGAATTIAAHVRRGHDGQPAGGPRRTRPLDALQSQPQRRGALIVSRRGDGLGQQVTRRVGLAAIEQRPARLEHLFGVTLLFAERRPGAIDVGAGPRVRAIQEQDARPEMNRVFVAAGEVADRARRRATLRPGCRV